MIIPVALAAALHACAPAAAPDTMAAIVAVESAGWPYAVNDNTARRSYRPRTREDALRVAAAALRAGHSIDVGIAQVNSENFRAFNVDAGTMLEPCANLRVGSAILANAYHAARARYPDRPQALWHAIMAYNSGSIYAGERYVRSVVAGRITVGADRTEHRHRHVVDDYRGADRAARATRCAAGADATPAPARRQPA